MDVSLEKTEDNEIKINLRTIKDGL